MPYHLKLSSLPRRRLLSTFLLALFLLFLLSSSILYHPSSSAYLRSAFSSTSTHPLSNTPRHAPKLYPPTSTACSLEQGCDYTPMTVAHSTLFDLHDGKVVDQDLSKYENDGGIFNPALLRMPAGSSYDFIGIARGPSKVSFENSVLLMPRTLVAWFANLQDDSTILQASRAVLLDLVTVSSPGCEFPWNTTPGPEDPRLLWSPPSSDSPTQVPILVLGMDTARPENCRSMGVMDLRLLWPELREELDRLEGKEMVSSDAEAEWAEGEGLVLDGGVGLEKGTEAWFEGQGEREKNWAAFFSPFEPHPHKHTLPLPSFHYNVVPIQELLLPSPFQSPSSSSPLAYNIYIPPNSTSVDSDDGTSPSQMLGKCVGRVVDADESRGSFKVGDHHASPFHPLTLTARSEVSEINSTNTVLIGLVHSKSMLFDDDQTWLYEQYLVVLNATAPYTPLGVSHVIPFSGLTPHKFYFSQSLTFLPIDPSPSPHSSQTTPSSFFPFAANIGKRWLPSNPFSHPSRPSEADLGISLSHGFVDDDVLIGLGEGDGSMGVVRMSVRALLRGVEDCSTHERDGLKKLYRF